jgi:hypothetical protein
LIVDRWWKDVVTTTNNDVDLLFFALFDSIDG